MAAANRTLMTATALSALGVVAHFGPSSSILVPGIKDSDAPADAKTMALAGWWYIAAVLIYNTIQLGLASKPSLAPASIRPGLKFLALHAAFLWLSAAIIIAFTALLRDGVAVMAAIPIIYFFPIISAVTWYGVSKDEELNKIGSAE